MLLTLAPVYERCAADCTSLLPARRRPLIQKRPVVERKVPWDVCAGQALRTTGTNLDLLPSYLNITTKDLTRLE
jgi:hypothetical protein